MSPSAAKAANHFGCLIAALQALRHPKARLVEAASFQGYDLKIPTSRKKREKWGTRPIQNKVMPWHA